MKLTVDKEADILSIRLREDQMTEESEEVEPGIIVDFAANGDIVGVEILHVSARVAPPVPLVEALRRIADLPPTAAPAAEIAQRALAQVNAK
jgi:uncharacterized protein YuzE